MPQERTDDQAPGPGGNSPRRRGGRHRALRVTAWTAAGLIVLGGSGLGYLYVKLNGNIRGIDINAVLGTDRPRDRDDGSMDVLVLGSDSRSGANAAYGREDGAARSDTAMIVHVHRGHRSASVVSIPRDTLVDRPACADGRGGTVPAARSQMFNAAYEVGGPSCTVKTVEAMSGIRMDHYVEVDFTGFKKLVDTLGGVRITTTRAIDDPKSRLRLPAGTHTLDGEQALGLVRTRHGVGDGSDLGRIQLQQAFLRSLIARIDGIGLFSNPTKLFDVADAATSALTTDSELDSVTKLAGFAGGLKDIGADDVDMITLPVAYDPADPNRVLPLARQGALLWSALKADRPVPAAATVGSAAGRGDAGRVITTP
ncbi:LCP family protein [Streptomyces sp. NPDC127068]|uniref:LCP family protein n=1 Tax=Streptomyces sp. NPDC127068 TaxID=3347127 RepID=UPI00364C3EEC